VRLISALALSGILFACGEDEAPLPPPTADADAGEVAPVDVGPEIGEDIVLPADLGPPDAEPDAETTDSVDVSDVEVFHTDADAGPPEVLPCDPALAFADTSPVVLTFGALTLASSGGTGHHRFTIVGEAHGAAIGAVTGVIVGGSQPATDIGVRLSDTACAGEATTSVQVVRPVASKPSSAKVPPGTTVNFGTTGGGGETAWSLVSNPSGATISPDGVYVAGASGFVDTVLLVDGVTGTSAVAVVVVDADASFEASPRHIAMPVGSGFVPTFVGGGTTVDLGVIPEGLVLEDGALVGESPGRYVLDPVDTSTTFVTKLVIDVLSPLPVETYIAGLKLQFGFQREVGDVDGDGFDDAILAVADASVASGGGGAIFWYRGDGSGLDPEPAQVLAGHTRKGYFGDDYVLGDVTGDGVQDLVVGASRHHQGATESGAVWIYPGVQDEDGFHFDAPPTLLYSGKFSYDRFGKAMGLCDVNADGHDDLVVIARYSEDRTADPITKEQGSLHLFLGGVEGLDDEPHQRIFGQGLVDGIWTHEAGNYMGIRVATGDVNGDGACDIVVGNHVAPNAQGLKGGAVYVYAGKAKTEESLGGLHGEPIRAIRSTALEEGNQLGDRFGVQVAVADITGDGLGDIIATWGFYDTPTHSNVGAVLLFPGVSQAAGVPASSYEDPSGGVWVATGTVTNQYLGWSLAPTDFDGDGDVDLLISTRNLANGEVSSAGDISVYDNEGGSLAAASVWSTGGVVAFGGFGTGIATLDDRDGDGKREVVTHASTDDGAGFDAGQPYLIRSASPDILLPLNYPIVASLSEIGQAVAFIPGPDGEDDLVVGAPRLDPPDGVNAGRALIFSDPGAALITEADHLMTDHINHSQGDTFGRSIAAAGDFTGDGLPDLAIVSQFEHLSGFYGNTYDLDPNCPDTYDVRIYNVGAVNLFPGEPGGGFAKNPSAVLFSGPVACGIVAVLGGLDINGDGVDDLVTSSPEFDLPGTPNCGQFQVRFGRAPNEDGTIEVGCTPTGGSFNGVHIQGRLGTSLARVGDLNEDGCDDFVVGEYSADYDPAGPQYHGALHVVFGWGGEGCPAEITRTVLTSPNDQDRLGTSVDGEEDFDGDGIPDLVAGGFGVTIQGEYVGGAWLIPGWHIVSLPAEPIVEGEIPTGHDVLPTTALDGLWMVSGKTSQEDMGRSVGFVRDAPGPGDISIAVGSRKGRYNGLQASGAVLLFHLDPLAPNGPIDPLPWAVFGGQTWPDRGWFGERLDVGTIGGSPALAIGAPYDSLIGLEEGSAYVVRLNATE
jgi:hypothetical protein